MSGKRTVESKNSKAIIDFGKCACSFLCFFWLGTDILELKSTLVDNSTQERSKLSGEEGMKSLPKRCITCDHSFSWLIPIDPVYYAKHKSKLDSKKRALKWCSNCRMENNSSKVCFIRPQIFRTSIIHNKKYQRQSHHNLGEREYGKISAEF